MPRTACCRIAAGRSANCSRNWSVVRDSIKANHPKGAFHRAHPPGELLAQAASSGHAWPRNGSSKLLRPPMNLESRKRWRSGRLLAKLPPSARPSRARWSCSQRIRSSLRRNVQVKPVLLAVVRAVERFAALEQLVAAVGGLFFGARKQCALLRRGHRLEIACNSHVLLELLHRRHPHHLRGYGLAQTETVAFLDCQPGLARQSAFRVTAG